VYFLASAGWPVGCQWELKRANLRAFVLLAFLYLFSSSHNTMPLLCVSRILASSFLPTSLGLQCMSIWIRILGSTWVEFTGTSQTTRATLVSLTKSNTHCSVISIAFRDPQSTPPIRWCISHPTLTEPNKQ
jgi:hypothetical protein